MTCRRGSFIFFQDRSVQKIDLICSFLATLDRFVLRGCVPPGWWAAVGRRITWPRQRRPRRPAPSTVPRTAATCRRVATTSWSPLSSPLAPLLSRLPPAPFRALRVPCGLTHQAHNSGVLSECAVRKGAVQEGCQCSSIPHTSRQGNQRRGGAAGVA